MIRADLIKIILENLEPSHIALFTTGMISREAFNALDRNGSFYMIGSMGLLSSIGLGIAMNQPKRRVVVVEGDGSALMGLGAIPQIAYESPNNLIHIILDNEAYESTGNQPTISSKIDISRYAKTSGYVDVQRPSDQESFEKIFQKFLRSNGPTFLHAKVSGRASKDISRVTLTPVELKDRFLEAVSSGA